jgi:hypothetical protein
MRFVIERTCGKTPDAPPDGVPLAISPPKLRTAADCTSALQKVTDAICAGTLDLVHGKLLLDAIETQAKLINVTDLEARLDGLERQAGMVDFRARRN